MSKSKFAQALEADWGFTDLTEAMQAVDKAARKAAALFEHITFDDAQQDAMCWLSVRPEQVAKAVQVDGWKQLAQDIYSGALKDPAMIEVRSQTTPMSTLEREEGWQF